jgi:hypothetical protein
MRIEPAPYTLAYYERQAKTLSVTTLDHAVRDIQDTLNVLRDRDTRDPYVAKLLAEMDAFTVELIRRKRLKK